MLNPLPVGPRGGLAAPWRAFKLIAGHPKLWPSAIAPFLINLALFALFFWFTYTRFDSWVRTLLPTGEGWWWQALLYFLLVLVVLLLLAVEVYIFTIVGRIIAAPFLEVLTRRAESLALGKEPDYLEPGIWQSMLRVLVQESKKLALYLGLMLLLLLFNLIPGLGSMIYAVLAGLITCFFLAAEFLDYPLERRSFSLGGKLGYVWRLRLSGLAFGAAVLCLGMVPVLNLALLPLAAVGGTLLFLDRPEEDRGVAQAKPPEVPTPPE